MFGNLCRCNDYCNYHYYPQQTAGLDIRLSWTSVLTPAWCRSKTHRWDDSVSQQCVGACGGEKKINSSSLELQHSSCHFQGVSVCRVYWSGRHCPLMAIIGYFYKKIIYLILYKVCQLYLLQTHTHTHTYWHKATLLYC